LDDLVDKVMAQAVNWDIVTFKETVVGGGIEIGENIWQFLGN